MKLEEAALRVIRNGGGFFRSKKLRDAVLRRVVELEPNENWARGSIKEGLLVRYEIYRKTRR